MPTKKFEILNATIEQDQQAVATQWANTFLHNPSNDIATNMTQLLAACVAAGDFKTRAYSSQSSELKAPSDQLTIIDYLSHASRIMVDYQQLDEVDQQELLAYFPVPTNTNGVVSRSATHDVNRKPSGEAIEGKGFMLGLAGQLPGVFKTPRDYGVNIAMGGEGQENFVGKKISANGFSGHFYFHRNDADNLLLLGLEQSAPAASVMELLWGSPSYPEEEQQGHDQFGQGHSLKGASDTYTAAGSLYFSDPVYQAKLLLEKGCFPPDKYGAMQVTINNENWPAIKEFLQKLKQAAESRSKEALIEQLLQKPATAQAEKDEYLSYIALDFGTYLKRINQVFIQDSALETSQKEAITLLETQLLTLIKSLQKGEANQYQAFNEKIEEINTNPTIPEAYQQAITRIQLLFQRQLQIDPNLTKTHQELLLKKQHEELQEKAKVLLGQLVEINKYFAANFIVQDDQISLFNEQLANQIGALNKILAPPVAEEVRSIDDISWIMLDNPPPEITEDSIEQLQSCLDQAQQCLGLAPKLYSEQTVNKLAQKLTAAEQEKNDLEQEHNTLKLAAAIQENKLQEAMVEITAIEQENQELFTKVDQLQAGSKELEKEIEQLKDASKKEQEKLREDIQAAERHYLQLLAHKEEQNNIALARMARLAPVVANIELMRTKATKLNDRGHFIAHAQADELIQGLDAAVKHYVNSEDNEAAALATFKASCRQHLEKPREELFEQRGFKKIIGNTLLAVGLLGVGYLAAIVVNKIVRNQFLFFSDTKTGKQVDKLRDSVDDVPIPAPDSP